MTTPTARPIDLGCIGNCRQIRLIFSMLILLAGGKPRYKRTALTVPKVRSVAKNGTRALGRSAEFRLLKMKISRKKVPAIKRPATTSHATVEWRSGSLAAITLKKQTMIRRSPAFLSHKVEKFGLTPMVLTITSGENSAGNANDRLSAIPIHTIRLYHLRYVCMPNSFNSC